MAGGGDWDGGKGSSTFSHHEEGVGSDCRMGALAGRGERPSSQVLTICTVNCSVDIPPQPNTPPGRAHAPEGQRCPGLLLPTRKSWAACPGQQKSGGVWWQLRPKVEMRGRRGLRPRSRDRGGEPALRTALLRPRGRGCRAVGQRASGAGCSGLRGEGGFLRAGPRTGTVRGSPVWPENSTQRERDLHAHASAAGAGPSLSLAWAGCCVARTLGERAAPSSARPHTGWAAAGISLASGYQCLESTSSGRRLSFLRLS